MLFALSGFVSVKQFGVAICLGYGCCARLGKGDLTERCPPKPMSLTAEARASNGRVSLISVIKEDSRMVISLALSLSGPGPWTGLRGCIAKFPSLNPSGASIAVLQTGVPTRPSSKDDRADGGRYKDAAVNYSLKSAIWAALP